MGITRRQFREAKIVAWRSGNREFTGLCFADATAAEKKALLALLAGGQPATQVTAPKVTPAAPKVTPKAKKGRVLPAPEKVEEGKARRGRKDASPNRVAHLWVSARSKAGAAYWTHSSECGC